MRWSEMRKRLLGVLVVTLVWGATSWSQSPTFSGSLGIEVAFTPSSSSLDLASAVTLALACDRAEVISRTELSLTGLEAEHLMMGVDLDGIGLRSGMRFDPCFSKYWFEVRGGCCPWELGGLFLVENLAGHVRRQPTRSGSSSTSASPGTRGSSPAASLGSA